MSVSFYLRDTGDGEVRTPQLTFSLQPSPTAPAPAAPVA